MSWQRVAPSPMIRVTSRRAPPDLSRIDAEALQRLEERRIRQPVCLTTRDHRFIKKTCAASRAACVVPADSALAHASSCVLFPVLMIPTGFLSSQVAGARHHATAPFTSTPRCSSSQPMQAGQAPKTSTQARPQARQAPAAGSSGSSLPVARSAASGNVRRATGIQQRTAEGVCSKHVNAALEAQRPGKGCFPIWNPISG
jgi:hypothetical protein